MPSLGHLTLRHVSSHDGHDVWQVAETGLGLLHFDGHVWMAWPLTEPARRWLNRTGRHGLTWLTRRQGAQQLLADLAADGLVLPGPPAPPALTRVSGGHYRHEDFQVRRCRDDRRLWEIHAGRRRLGYERSLHAAAVLIGRIGAGPDSVLS